MALPSHSRGRGRTVLLFTRSPREEAKAKRLPGSGARLFEELVRGWRERANEVGAELLAVTPEESAAGMEKLLPGAGLLLQQGNSFAEHLEAAFGAAFARGASAVAIVPGDCPPPEAEALEELFRGLEADGRAMAIAPAADGGVNLIGFAPDAERRLEDIAWFGPNVCRDLRFHAERLGLPLFMGALSFDVDDEADVRALYRRSAFDARWRRFRALLAEILNGRPRHEACGPVLPEHPSVAGPQGRGPPPPTL